MNTNAVIVAARTSSRTAITVEAVNNTGVKIAANGVFCNRNADIQKHRRSKSSLLTMSGQVCVGFNAFLV